MATTPTLFSTPKAWLGQASVANTNRDGSGTLATVVTAGANGSKIEHIDYKAVGTTTTGMLRFYISDGTNHRLWTERTVTAITPSASVASFEGTIDCSEPDTCLVLPSGYSLRVSTHNAETFNVVAFGGDA